ncbi:thymidylate synthase [Henriciella marina]|uniref:thymidylate synthase n=1 Tax=Henriciella marina TaxID=453851 RepID=A0ABT4LZ08_9PROT|nr:thymidylate synthase [Henriciella marina]MCZ4298364.1 thymidylate synthase [Henriciella marina]
METDFDSLDQVLVFALRKIICSGHEIKPRGQVTREILNFNFCLADPRARLILNSAARWSLPLAIGEFCWHSSGSDSVDAIAYYASAWRDTSDDGAHIAESCYGAKVFADSASDDQWRAVVNMLKHDINSRRACITLARPLSSLDVNAKDLSCTTSCQFMVRSGCVHCFVTMRSNDAIWGLPYDVFFFSMLQERLALELGCKLGKYYHQASSLHLYERHYSRAQRIIEADTPNSASMRPMSDLHLLSHLLQSESSIRSGQYEHVETDSLGYWGRFEQVLRDFSASKSATSKETLRWAKLISSHCH